MSKQSDLLEALSTLIDSGEALGLSGELDDFAVAFNDSIEEGLEAWGEECEEQWKEDAPWQTENLRNSIAYEVNADDMEAWVGVDVDRLLSVAGQELPFKRCVYYYQDETVDSQIMPDKDYTWDAERKAVSAGGVDVPPKNAPHTPFIDVLWREQAKVIKERIFG